MKKWKIKEKWTRISLIVTKEQKKILEDKSKKAEVSLNSYIRSQLFK